jgi:glutamine synthetase
VVREDIRTCAPIRFDGNGYSQEWQEEAKRRGLDTERSTPLSIDCYLEEKSVRMFERTHVFKRYEIEARNEIKWETYTKKVQIEARVFGDLCMNHIIPTATRYQSHLIENVDKMQRIFPAEVAAELNAQNIDLICRISEHTRYIAENITEMVEQRKIANRIENIRQRAIAYNTHVAPMLTDIRHHVDQLELIVDDEMWPLPKYREMLFIR